MPTTHRVKDGECISSIADSYGFFWQSIWSHADNADIRLARKDPNVLKVGDILVVPDKEIKQESRAADAKHRFKKLGTPAKLRVQLKLDDEPLANKPYTLIIDGLADIEGITDADGFVKESIPPNAKTGILRIDSDTEQMGYHFNFGTLDPITEDSGVAGRLENLGFSQDDGLPEAIRAFQSKYDLSASGQLDEKTRAKIKEAFGE